MELNTEQPNASNSAGIQDIEPLLTPPSLKEKIAQALRELHHNRRATHLECFTTKHYEPDQTGRLMPRIVRECDLTSRFFQKGV